MPILISLDELLARRKMSLTELSAAVEITLANLSILNTGKARAIRFPPSKRFAKSWICQPGEILAFETDSYDRACARFKLCSL